MSLALAGSEKRAGSSSFAVDTSVIPDPEMLANAGIYPDAETMQHLQWIEDIGEALELYDLVWTEFKAAAGG